MMTRLGKEFELTLLIQSIAVIIFQMMLVALCTEVRATTSARKTRGDPSLEVSTALPHNLTC